MEKPTFDWVREKLEDLRSLVAPSRLPPLFEPTGEIYEKLATGEDEDLQHVNNLIGQHLGLLYTPVVRYEWGLKLSHEAIGDIQLPGSSVSVIRVPFFCVGKPYLIGTVLAHEMTHQWLFLNGVGYQDQDMNEKLTDLASFALGLGKLMLNGLSEEACGFDCQSFVHGYIEPDLMLYAYGVVNKFNGVSLRGSTKFLCRDVVRMVMESQVILDC